MLSSYVLNVKPYSQLFLCVYGIYFAAKYNFQRFIKSQRGFSNAGAGAGYTFYPHSNQHQVNIYFYIIIFYSQKQKREILYYAGSLCLLSAELNGIVREFP